MNEKQNHLNAATSPGYCYVCLAHTHTVSLSLSLSLCLLPLSRLASAKEAVSVKLNEKRFSCCCVFPSVVALALIEILRKANSGAPRWAPPSSQVQ